MICAHYCCCVTTLKVTFSVKHILKLIHYEQMVIFQRALMICEDNSHRKLMPICKVSNIISMIYPKNL